MKRLPRTLCSKPPTFYLPYAIYLFLSLFILGPALAPGHLFLLDMPGPASFQLSDHLQGGIQPHFATHAVLTLLNTIIPAAILQKLVLILVLTFAGISTYTLANHVLKTTLKQKVRATHGQNFSALYAGVLAMLNPFVFERLAAGQWLVIAGYAYTPFVIYSYLKWRSTWKFWLAYALLPVISIHFWGMLTVLMLIVLLVFDRATLKHVTASAKLYAVFACVNSYWIVSLLLDRNERANGLMRNDFEAFQTISDQSVGILGNVLSLHGFWRPQSDLIKTDNALWFAYALIILGLAAYGILQAWSEPKIHRYAKNSALAFVLALIFAIGYGHPTTQTILEPFTYIPIAASLRETAKAVGLLGLLYAFWAPYGLWRARQKLKDESRKLLAAGVLVTIVMMSGMFFGLSGTLRSLDYPAGWHEVNKIASADSKALILPWQGYLELNFADNAFVANPARSFFEADIVQSSNAGNPLLDNYDDPIKQILDDYLDGIITYAELSEALQQHDQITSIIILKTGNWNRYEKIQDEPNIQVIFGDESITIIEL